MHPWVTQRLSHVRLRTSYRSRFVYGGISTTNISRRPLTRLPHSTLLLSSEMNGVLCCTGYLLAIAIWWAKSTDHFRSSATDVTLLNERYMFSMIDLFTWKSRADSGRMSLWLGLRYTWSYIAGGALGQEDFSCEATSCLFFREGWVPCRHMLTSLPRVKELTVTSLPIDHYLFRSVTCLPWVNRLCMPSPAAVCTIHWGSALPPYGPLHAVACAPSVWHNL